MGEGQLPTTASGSIAFDRAAEIYDSTRALSPETLAAVISLLTAELSGRGGRTLEIGIGTGRIALPLFDAGIPMAGVDLSGPMLARLVEKSGGVAPFPIARGDATRLPFPDGAFAGTYACHVLHLIPDWRGAARELVRVIQPAGIVLVDRGGWSPLLREIEGAFREVSGDRVQRPGLSHDDAAIVQLDEHMSGLGARPRDLPPVLDRRLIPIGRVTQMLRDNVFSWTWSLDAETNRRATDAAEAFAFERFGDLDEPRQIDAWIRWRAYDLP